MECVEREGEAKNNNTDDQESVSDPRFRRFGIDFRFVHGPLAAGRVYQTSTGPLGTGIEVRGAGSASFINEATRGCN